MHVHLGIEHPFQYPGQSFAVVAARCLGLCESEQWFRVRLHVGTPFEILAAGLRCYGSFLPALLAELLDVEWPSE